MSSFQEIDVCFTEKMMNFAYYSNLRYSRLSPKGKFLFWWMLYIFGYFNNVLTNNILPNRDVSLVINTIIGIYAFYKFRYRGKDTLYCIKNTIGIWLLILVMLVSPLVPMLEYGQPYLNTIISERFNFAILFFLVLLSIKPSQGELLYILKTGAHLSVILFLVGVFFPSFFIDSATIKETLLSRAEHESTDIGFGCPGFGIIVMYSFFSFVKLTQNPKLKDIIEMTMILGVIVALQNRSTLIGVIPAFCWCLLKARSKNKIIIYGVIGIIVLMLIPYIHIIYKSLMEETQLQLEDENYNRWQALSFYLIEMKTNIWHYLLGNGVWSSFGEYNKLMVIAQEYRGCYISDIGILGAFFYYGIIPLYVIYKYCFTALRFSTVPLALKLYTLWIIFVPTIQPYLLLNEIGNVNISLFFYLVTYYTQINNGHICYHSKLQYKRHN